MAPPEPAHSLIALLTGESAAVWHEAGFAVRDDVVAVGGVDIVCTADGAGHDRWSLAGPDVPADVDGISTTTGVRPERQAHANPNGVVALDHVVVRSPDLDRTTDALVALGLDLRRIRDVPLPDNPIQQRFFRFDNAIVELVGPPTPSGDEPATIWGIAAVVSDIDATAAVLGPRCSTPKDAVQPGRRIATLRTADLGIAMAVAFMTPHRRERRGVDDE